MRRADDQGHRERRLRRAAPAGRRARSIPASLGLLVAVAGLLGATVAAGGARVRSVVPFGAFALLVLSVVAVAGGRAVAARIRDGERDAAVATSTARLAALVENSTDLITVCDADNVLTYASPAVQRVLGATAPGRVGQPVGRYVHPDDRAALGRVVSRARSHPGTPESAEFRLRHEDGSYRWVESTIVDRLDDPAVGGIVSTTRDITDRVAATAELAHRANHDPLTGMPNRRYLETHRVPGTGPLALLFVDLDHFKHVNDELGHGGGDRVLVRTAEALRASVRPEDLVVRMGGDEFVVLARVEDDVAAAHLGARVCDAVRQPMDLDGRLVVIGASVGVATSTEGFDDGLLRLADDAMYRAKALGRGRVVTAADLAALGSAPAPTTPGQARYEQMLGSSLEAIAVHVGGRLVGVSPGALAVLGVERPEDVLGRHVFEFVADDSLPLTQERRASVDGGTWPVEEAVTVVRADGERVLIDVDSTPVPWKGEVAVQLRLRPVAVRWDVILHAAGGVSAAMGEAVVVTDLDLRIVTWNAAATDLYGWPADEVVGRHVVDVVPWAGDLSSLTGAAQQLQAEGQWRGRAAQRRRDGTVIEVEARTHLLRDHDGRPVGVVSVNTPEVVDVRDQAAPVLAAIAAGEMVVHHQPVVRARDGRCVEVEALVRWQHPERGLLPPSAFVPLLERAGAIAPLTDFVLRTAAVEVAAWRAAGAADLALSVNLSGAELTDPTLTDRIAAALDATGLPADALWLEVTETAVTADTAAASSALAALAALGCRIALDDFGTGFASFALLHSVVVHALKVDRMFVAALTEGSSDLAIVRSVRTLAHELGAVVVAEGVETEAQEVLLQVLGCDLLQGFLYGRPVPAAQLDPRALGARTGPQASTGR